MKYASIHPAEYLRAHLVYEQIRITILSLLTSPKILPIILGVLVLGGLYNILAQLNNVGTVSVEEVYAKAYPYEMPNIVMSPMVGLPPH